MNYIHENWAYGDEEGHSLVFLIVDNIGNDNLEIAQQLYAQMLWGAI